VDDEFAKKNRFGKRIVHGMLIASFFSNIVGNKLPGPGSVFVSYKVKFKKPVFIGDTVETKVEIIRIDKEKCHIELAVSCINQNGELVMEGNSVVQPPVPLD
jgi:acyl dehydratase